MIEVFKHEESGHGDILSTEFVEWRTRLSENENRENGEAAKTGLLDSINDTKTESIEAARAKLLEQVNDT